MLDSGSLQPMYLRVGGIFLVLDGMIFGKGQILPLGRKKTPLLLGLWIGFHPWVIMLPWVLLFGRRPWCRGSLGWLAGLVMFSSSSIIESWARPLQQSKEKIDTTCRSKVDKMMMIRRPRPCGLSLIEAVEEHHSMSGSIQRKLDTPAMAITLIYIFHYI